MTINKAQDKQSRNETTRWSKTNTKKACSKCCPYETKFVKKGSLEDEGKEAMPLLRNIHHFVFQLCFDCLQEQLAD